MISISKWGGVEPSIGYDTYWKFACERQKVFWEKLKGCNSSLTNDEILKQYKFTNPYRACDRVSQFLIRDVIYSDTFTHEDTFLRVILFKLFNKVETWKLLESKFGVISVDTFDAKAFACFLDEQMHKGIKIYSNAYMMASGCKEFNVTRKHQAHLLLVKKMLNEHLPMKVHNSESMEEAYKLLLAYPMIGKFLAYQYVTDLNYSEITDFSESEFTVPGPGAKDGIKKCFISTGNYTDSDIIKIMAERQEYEFERLGLEFYNLGGRKLQYIDTQNLFCETDKYCRVAHPELSGVSGRQKIKQKYRPTREQIQFTFPPKWGINMESIYGSRQISGVCT
ncbi:hypothetical protein AC626_06525 [Pseudoalteromonas rubra]|uniref:5-hmdU DNA kinase helical domain-containing protein n=2 Tax=Pseudoalteromonas TaxID=53246 RepID=A0A0L0EUJ2_9GAMM|nr:hypothetical protein AC626_06525 [Pseudoalteromonas rubra]